MSKEKESRSAVSAGIGYTIGNILIKGINFLSVPLFSRIMTPDELGVYSAFVAYDSILFVILSLAIHSSVKNAKYTFSGEVDEYTSSVSLILWMNMAIGLIVATLFSGPLSSLLGLPVVCLYLLVFMSFGSSVLNLYNCRISLDYNYKGYLFAAFANTVGNLLVSLVLIHTIFQNQKDLGRIIGVSVTMLLLALVLLGTLYHRAKPKFERRFWKYAVRYSLPLVPHGLSQVLLGQFDRIMIRSMVSDAAAGIYSVVANISLILTIIIDSVSTAWTTWFYEAYAEKKIAEIQKRAVQLTIFFAILAIGLMALSPELVWILGGTQYESGKYVAIPLILSAFAVFIYNVVVPVEYFHEKTMYIMIGTAAAGVVDIVLNYIFIMKYGFIAAAYTTLVAYICYAVLHFFIARKLSGISILPFKVVCFIVVLLLCMAALNLVFISSVIIRYFACAVVVIPMGLLLLKRLFKEKNQNG